jgi:hypothetical protein
MAKAHDRMAYLPALFGALAVPSAWSAPASASQYHAELDHAELATDTLSISYDAKASRPSLLNDQSTINPDRDSNALHTPRLRDSKLPQSRRYRASAKV